MGEDFVPAIALYNARKARRLQAVMQEGRVGRTGRGVAFTLVDLPSGKALGAGRSWQKVLLALNKPGATEGTIFGLLQALEAKSPITSLHCIRVAGYAAALAMAIDLSDSQVEHVQRCGLLHDIGKIGISDVVLEKAGPLTDQEWALIKDHPTIGVQTLQPCQGLSQLLPAVAMHHERFDGSGYPHAVAGYAIPLEARIVAIADAYDTMTSDRPYRKGFDPREALRRLREGAGTQFDPVLVDAFATQVFPHLTGAVGSVTRKRRKARTEGHKETDLSQG